MSVAVDVVALLRLAAIDDELLVTTSDIVGKTCSPAIASSVVSKLSILLSNSLASSGFIWNSYGAVDWAVKVS